MLKQLKEDVLETNLSLPDHGLVKFTWGNVSGIDRTNNLVVIKPSGVEYAHMTLNDLVVVDLISGRVVEGNKKPSSDIATHLVLYRAFPEIGGVVHTHSKYAASFAQAGKDIIAFGTTHGDTFYGNIPCTRAMTASEIEGDYELETGNVIVDEFNKRNLSYHDIPGVVVYRHGPFAWGKDAYSAVYNAVVMEEVAYMNINTKLINSEVTPIEQQLLDKHFLRKHGKNAYYGQ